MELRVKPWNFIYMRDGIDNKNMLEWYYIILTFFMEHIERLYVKKYAKQTKSYFNYKCSFCGKIKKIRDDHVRYERIKSCGCQAKNMGYPPSDKHEIDRIDPYGNYSKWNWEKAANTPKMKNQFNQ